MNVAPNAHVEGLEDAIHKLQSQLNKCLNEKRRRQCEIRYLDELAGLISASASDMCSLSASAKPDKCAILQETVNQVRQIKLAEECGTSDVLQQSEVSSSKPSILANDVLGSVLLKALDGFLFMVNTDGKIEFVSENIKSFLKYDQESLVDKSIYNIIHVGDHARFSSNLLPMSIGNGLGWSPEPNATVSKSRTFNCRFLIKPPEDQEETMEDKQTRVSQYENMQIAAVLLPFSGEKTENELNCEIQNHLVCVARRLPSNEKNNSSTVEQFTTRLDMTGKILTVDTSGVSAIYSQYLNKELVGHIIQELCHPNDFPKLNQHLKETLQLGSNTSGVYRLRIAQEKYIQVQTKSKRFNYNPMANEQEFIVATHSIIRDNDHPDVGASATQHCSQSPSNASLNSGLNNTVNGSSYSFQSLSPQEFNLNDLGLDLFPSSSWDLTTDGTEVNETSNIQTSLSGPSRPESTSSVVSVTQRTQPHPGSAFNTEFISGRGSPSVQSPTQLSSTSSPRPGSVTSFTNTFPFSPGPPQSLSQTSSPAPALLKRDDLSTNNLELSNLSPVSGLMSENQGLSNPAQKLRNLLTHGIEEADSSVPKNSALGNSSVDASVSSDNETNSTCANADSASSRNENIILRELLNQEDEDDVNEDSVNNVTQLDAHVGNSSTPMDICSNEALQKRTINNNNNMLRKLLNSDEDVKKTPDMLIQHLLKTEGKVADSSMVSSGKAGGAALSSTLVDALASVKRKSPDAPSESSASKRQNLHNIQHAHLAGQNPMLASMLAQTPRTAPSVPTSIANAIVSQLPQERLPKNLEKKLVHTPYTGTTTPNSSNNNQQYSYIPLPGSTRSVLSTSLQQEVVTADTRGHVTLAPQNNLASTFQQTQGFLGKLLPPFDGSQGTINVYEDQFVHNSQPATGLQPSANPMFHENPLESSGIINVVGTSDPDLAEILDQVWSMEQDLNMDSTSSEDLAIYNIVDEIPTTAPSASPRPSSGHEEDSKTAIINAIQLQLMSCEVTNTTVSPGNNSHFSPASTPTLAAISSHLPSNSFSQVNHYQAAPPAYSSAAPGQRTRAPTMHSIQTGASSSTQQIVPIGNQRQPVPHFVTTEMSPQMRRQMMERKQKILHQHSRRMLLQKQQLALRAQIMAENLENLPSSAGTTFQETLNDPLNTSVVSNVALQQRAASVPDQQLSPRFTTIPQMSGSIGQPSSPSQLSPGQRQQPSFSQLSQPTYPNNYPPARLSPHITSPPQQSPTQTWVQRTSQNSANLQQQNPMLNAQLSQGSFMNQTQSRFPNQTQQPRQVIVRSLPSPNPRNSPYSNSPDSPFHPPSPGVSLYQQSPAPTQSQQPQQRLQRAVSVPSRVNSPRSLQAGYVGADPLLSPQPSPGNYNTTNYNSTIAVSTSSGYNPDNFGYDQQIYPATSVDRSRGSGNSMTSTSEFVRQELRAMVGARTQQQQQQQQQQQHQQQQQQQQHHQVHQQLVPQLSQASISQSANQSFSHSDFEALGFSLELGSDGQQSSPSLFPQSLLNVAGGSDNQSRTNSPRFQVEEHRPAEKKSLLQQLLSEPP